MNTEDAKVPNVEGDWQSIEIFLFSNGQQYSPPRKYLLRVDDLNLWDITLNHLAQSHYGLQSPLIDLYTTNGQLVRGPLDLIDGQAYVAVVPPDTFVDAGYQKYLMKASKSWEKRQARKFPPECVLGEPCCLCPERQRSCCDPLACCLCPEREDAESQEQLLRASRHVDLGPPSGHFMSSAPAKSVAADDNEPVSGKTACATCGHVIRPGLIEYSPVQGPAKSDGYKARHDGKVVSPCEYEARLGENATRLCEYRPNLSEVAARLAEYGTGPREYETIPSVNGAKPGEYRVRPGENVTRPAEYGVTKQGEYKTTPTVNGTRLGEFGVRPGEYDTRPGEYGAKPDEYESRPSVNGATPSDFGTRPGDYGAILGKYKTRTIVTGPRPSEYETRPSANEVKPYEYGAGTDENEIRSTANGVKPGEYGARPLEYNSRPSVNGAKIGEFGARPGEYETRPSVNQAKQAECGIKPVEYETRPSLNGAKPVEYETRPSLNGAKPGEYETRPSLNGARPGEYETRPSLNGARPGEYETRPSVNQAKQAECGIKPDEYETRPTVNGAKLGEYETKPSLNRAKSGEYETRPTLNGAKPGEYEIRPCLNGAKPDEYETRPSLNEAKPTEYETRQRLNRAKPGEYETRPSLNGAKPGEYDTRPNFSRAKPAEYETKPSLNRANPSEYNNRPSLNRANPSEYNNRTSLSAARTDEYDPKPNLNGARPGKCETKPYVKPGEYGAIPGESGSGPDEYKTRPNVNGAKLGEIGARPADYATRSSEQENKPDENGPSSVKKGAWSGENGDRTASHKTRPGHSGYRSSKIEPIQKAYEIFLHKNEKSLEESEDTLDKDTAEKDASIKSEFPRQGSTLDPIGENGLEQNAKYRTREEIESKDRSSRNGRKGGERRVSSAEKNIRENDTVTGLVESKVRKIENARKLSRRSGAEIEQRSRTGEPTRGFEHGGRVSAQKGRETNPASRVSVQGARENGTRLSAQTNKQSDDLARLGGRESRMGDHEARAGDLGLGTSGHDAGLENSVSEPGAGAATSGSRASPKDRMSSKIKTNLGLPKTGTPGTRVNETLVRLNDADIENKEDNPRQSRVGSTEAAGILHISEAQHHARRNKLSAGRPTIEKKRLSIEQNSTSLRKPTQNSNILRKTEIKQPVKTNKENLLKKMNEKSSAIPVPASNDYGKSKTQCITPPVLPPTTISTTELITSTMNKAPPENAIDEHVVLTRSFKNTESGTMGLDSVKQIVDTIENSPAETQTDLIYIEKSMANVSVNEGFQTDTEAVEKHEKEVSASNKQNTNSCTCVLCKQLHCRVDPDENDENTLSMLNRGGVVNIKLNIQVRNIVKSVYSCQKDCGRSQSLTNITRSEKESHISIDNDMVVNRTSLQSLFNKPNFQGFGFEGSPKVMVVQCAGCGRLNNPPQCDPSPCCDNNKKYFVLLENSVLEDMEDGCNFTPPRRPCDQRQSRKQSSGFPLTQVLSETTLDTITTVTVSGVPLQRREMGKCVNNTSCQTEEPQSESVIAKRKVSITENSVTKGDLQKKSSSSVCVTTQPDNLVLKQSCRKMCSQKCELEDSQVCSEVCRVVCPPTTDKVEALCSSVRSPSCEIVETVCLQVRPPTCEVKAECSQVSSQACQVQSKGCQQANPQVQSQGCMPSPTYTSFCLMVPPPCTQAQTQVCPCQGPQVCNAETQTRWASILLQARLHCDGRYSFHLPPLYLLKNNNSCCQ